MLTSFIEQSGLPTTFEQTAQQWFTPLAKRIAEQSRQQQAPFTLGINGCQGSGKSTLASYLHHYLSEQAELSVVNLSLDDFYFDQATRQQLAQAVHPMLATRGVPGTHDTRLLASTLKQLIKGEQVPLPSFDKARDNPTQPSQWPLSPPRVDVIIIEGWCWGVGAQNQHQLLKPINTLESTQDDKGVWRNYVNDQLVQYYQPLYSLMDKWLMLKAPSFKCVANWRWQQEQQLAAQQTLTNTKAMPSKVMNQAQVMAFIAYFQRLTEHSLTTLPKACDLVFELDEHRTITSAIGNI
ncbi:kinase [Thalassotalea euphylliae]|uniref:Kinase n=1 Tax=Thalassotalea euphylliae TaxID=1655234 RepID=A0A3E0TVM7_9GAMM|nr:kinase [Thalassotalea euphylliae]REL28504.1 kinase [Thalassotalea euphylliae]